MPEPEPLYTPLFCEENIWQLLRRIERRKRGLSGLFVVVVCNSDRHVVLRHQRAAEPGAYVVWDYHVLLLDRDRGLIYDLDSRFDCPVSASSYLGATLPDPARIRAAFIPMFRVIPAADFRRLFSSDRTHMHGRVAPAALPPWPAIAPPPGQPRVRLDEYWDPGLDIAGTRVMTQPDFVAFAVPGATA